MMYLNTNLYFRISYRASNSLHDYKFPNILEDVDILINHPTLDNLPDNVQILLPTFRYRYLVH